MDGSGNVDLWNGSGSAEPILTGFYTPIVNNNAELPKTFLKPETVTFIILDFIE